MQGASLGGVEPSRVAKSRKRWVGEGGSGLIMASLWCMLNSALGTHCRVLTNLAAITDC